MLEGIDVSVDAVSRILREHSIDVVMHFAAYAYVGESVGNPRKYYQNNVVETQGLLDAMLQCKVQKFVFSSTCATFGESETLPIKEDTPQAPINPYGYTKLVVENVLKDYAHAYGLNFAAFRYFNAAGASPQGDIGESHDPETHLIPIVFDVAMGKRDHVTVFGDDYPTEDGSCLRDYVHVNDLVNAYIAVFEKLEGEGSALFFNLDTGKPVSVFGVIKAVEKATGLPIKVVVWDRRPRDPSSLYADNTKAREELGWDIEYPTIDSIIETAWAWHMDHSDGY